MKLFTKQTPEQKLNNIAKNVLFNLNQSDLNHTEKAIVVRMVEKELKEVRELELEDIVNANSI